MAPRTPTSITPEILRLCHAITPNAHPQLLPVMPVSDVINDCFPIVAEHVKRHGGSVCHGWRIWEEPRLLIEAEFHAVWHKPDEELLDVSPNEIGETRVLFLPDSQRIYQGRGVNNVRHPLSPDPAIQEFIGQCDAEFEFVNRGARAEQHGVLELTIAENIELESIRAKKSAALMRAFQNLPRPGRNDSCPCGSGRKFKKCHGT